MFADIANTFCDQVFEMCQRNYSAGGDTIVECFTRREVVAQFSTLEQVRDFCGLKVEQALNARWGEDSDPELERYRAYQNWK